VAARDRRPQGPAAAGGAADPGPQGQRAPAVVAAAGEEERGGKEERGGGTCGRPAMAAAARGREGGRGKRKLDTMFWGLIFLYSSKP